MNQSSRPSFLLAHRPHRKLAIDTETLAHVCVSIQSSNNKAHPSWRKIRLYPTDRAISIRIPYRQARRMGAHSSWSLPRQKPESIGESRNQTRSIVRSVDRVETVTSSEDRHQYLSILRLGYVKSPELQQQHRWEQKGSPESVNLRVRTHVRVRW